MPDIAAAARLLYEARENRQPISPLRETCGLRTAEEAYAVQKANTLRWREAGRRAIGRKIGLTSKAVQQQLGVAEPDFGVLWGDLCFGPDEPVPAAEFMQPKAEVEIAFLLKKPLAHPQLHMHDVITAIDCVLPAVEIVDSAVADWNIRLVDTIADNASSGGLVLAPTARALGQVDLQACGMTMVRDGAMVSHGVGAACLGHPLNAVLWLARKMVEVGEPLADGDLILSGALGPMVSLAGGQRFQVEIQGFPAFHFSCEA